MSGSNMQVVRLTVIASLVSFVIWQFNFSMQGVESARHAPFNADLVFNVPEGKQHVMVTGGAGFIGSLAALTLLEAGHAVTVIDNLSRGNYGAVQKLMSMFEHSA